MKQTTFTLVILLFKLLFINDLSAQQLLKGNVFDSKTKEPIVGANVLQKGTLNGTTTDIDGNFSFEVDKLPAVINISFLGYEKKDFEVKTSGIITIALVSTDQSINEVVVLSRRRKEEVQDIPIPITVLNNSAIENSVSFNVNRVKELVPSVQLYSSNPRNTTLNIRGLGSTFGLTNDGLDPGVGFYVDGVYYARPAATTIDFIDIEQIEVLRGPQGTLFGKNTTAGAFNVTSKRPSHETGGNFELSYGNFGFIQAKGSFTGSLVKDKLATRLSFTGTHRDGTLYNVATQKHENSMNNLGVRGQLLYTLNDDVDFLLSVDHSRQRPTGYAQVYAGTAPTQRAEFRQFESIIADLGYDLPSRNPFDRIIDHDTPWQSDQDLGGISLNVDAKKGPGTLTSTTAWRYWNWGPSNDRDFTGLQGLSLSQAPSRHDQWSQEFRYAGEFSEKLSGVAGLFYLGQNLESSPYHTEEAGIHQWRFSQSSTSPLWQTEGLLEGYGIRTYNRLVSHSAAVFGQLDWKISNKFNILPGIRFNYDYKQVNFRRETYGGLDTDDPDLIAIKRSVYNNQQFDAETNNFNVSGQFTAAYKPIDKVNLYATYSLSYKPVGLNLGGLPNQNGQPMTELAVIKPELVNHVEVGVKTQPIKGGILNFTLFNTEIKDYQTIVQTADLAVNRGYLANAERVRVTGAELDLSYRVNKFVSLNSSVNYTDGRYVKFENAPVPLEETGGATFKDISGGDLPGISNWAISGGAEFTLGGKLFKQEGNFFLGFDTYYRSGFSSSPSPSQFLNIDGYALLNARLGFRAYDGLTFFVWCRNLLDKDYFEMLLPGGGNIGHFAGVLGDPRTFGATIRYNFSK
jgi:iron complex outermembrane recepter protein